MDPNQALVELRAAIEDLRAAADGDSNDAEIDAAHRLADSVAALDEWLSNGGYRPDAWQRS